MYDEAVSDGRVADTPLGQPCTWCGELIVNGDRGFITNALDVVGHLKRVPIHRECELRSVIGSVGHQLGKCRCYVVAPAPAMDDPEGMTKRQAALAAFELFVKLAEERYNAKFE